MGRYRLSPLADRDLSEIWTYIAERDLGGAERLLGEIETKLQMLADLPLLGRERPELRAGYRSFVVGRYVIFYAPLGDGIAVARVLHGMRRLEDLL